MYYIMNFCDYWVSGALGAPSAWSRWQDRASGAHGHHGRREIANAGHALGPSLFVFPNLFHQVFRPAVGLGFNILSQIGLILLMFLIGLEFDFSHLRTHGDFAFPICLLEIILPFGAPRLAPDASGIQYQPQRVWAL